MPGTTISASSVYVEYGYEDSFAGGSTSLPLIFGNEQKATGLTFNVNQLPLGQLYSPEIESFVYNRTEGKVSMDYILSHPWNFSSIFGSPKSVDATPNTHTWDSDPDSTTGNLNPSTRQVLTMAVEIGYRSALNNTDSFKRNILGAISPTMSFKMSLNEPVRVTQEIVWGKESATSGTLINPTGNNDGFVPYVFANAQIELPDGTVIATVQDFDLNINSNAELIYEIGSREAVNAYRKILEMTGKLNLTVQDSTFYDFVSGRTELATLTVIITNGLTADATKKIEMSFTGVGLGTYNNTGIEPGELVLQDVDFQCRKATVVALNDSTQPDSN